MNTVLEITIDRFKQPEYTGENRCLPCTLLNGALALLIAAISTILFGPTVGLPVFAASIIAIVLRGYLVPGTPRLTKAYLPDSLRPWFEGHKPSGNIGEESDLDIEAFLQTIGAAQACEQANDICLTDTFRTEWRQRIQALKADGLSQNALASLLEIDPDQLDVAEFDGSFVAHFGDARVGKWESEAAYIADIAAASTIAERTDSWLALDVAQRGTVLYALRVFLEYCPSCEGSVSVSEETVESCCHSRDVIAVDCQNCGARFFETDGPASGSYSSNSYT